VFVTELFDECPVFVDKRALKVQFAVYQQGIKVVRKPLFHIFKVWFNSFYNNITQERDQYGK